MVSATCKKGKELKSADWSKSGKKIVCMRAKKKQMNFFFSPETYTKKFVIAFGVDLKLGKSLREIM